MREREIDLMLGKIIRMFVFFISVRPTLDVLQKARSNMEHHLKDTNLSHSGLSKNFQSHRTNRLD